MRESVTINSVIYIFLFDFSLFYFLYFISPFLTFRIKVDSCFSLCCHLKDTVICFKYPYFSVKFDFSLINDQQSLCGFFYIIYFY